LASESVPPTRETLQVVRAGSGVALADRLVFMGLRDAARVRSSKTGIVGFMASVNLELVRCIYTAWGRGDYRSADWADPDIEYVQLDGPAPGSWIGLAGMAEAWRAVLSSWEDLRVEAEEYRELDDERVLVLNHFSGRGKASGVEVQQIWTTAASLFHVCGGKVIRLVQYWDHQRAFADLGLASGGGSRDS
jgi:ketosteroid isomerase-like protein